MTTQTSVGCTVCGCVCDDLAVAVENGRVTAARGACHLAEPWFLSQNATRPPAATVGDQPAEPEAAFDRAAEILRAARYPLVYGLSRSTTEAQRAAVALTEKLGGTVDTTASTGHAPSLMALQQVGESTCTLGEVKNRADLVVFWGSDPVVTHPRHMERYSVDAVGRWVPGGRAGRFVVVVDDRVTESAKRADLFVPVPSGRNWEALWTLRMLCKGLAAPAPEPLAALAARVASARCGAFFFGAGLTRERQAHRAVEALLQLVSELNDRGRFYARRMRRYGDVAGADSVLAWQTGYPFGVNLSRGYPRYNPGEFTGPEMLARGEPDACLLIGSETAADFPPAAIEHLRRVPVIALDSANVAPPVPAAVRFTTAVYGVHRPGTAYRMDEVPVPLRVILPTDYPSDAEVLNELLKRVG
ncbi:MAG: formylmethanofuran dehydrogenase subunit B [Planctomycetes bacterium]|nr:formylmethanofuran dehydrogenase subunit B [Planctomycetota bacterium]